MTPYHVRSVHDAYHVLVFVKSGLIVVVCVWCVYVSWYAQSGGILKINLGTVIFRSEGVRRCGAAALTRR